MFHEVKFSLSESQLKKLAYAHKHKIGISLRLSKDKINASGTPLLITENEYKKLEQGGIHSINISASRIKKLEKVGGFIQALLPFLPAIISGIAGLTGIASNVKKMVDGRGIISDLGIPVISPLAKIIGLGNKKKYKKGKGYIHSHPPGKIIKCSGNPGKGLYPYVYPPTGYY